MAWISEYFLPFIVILTILVFIHEWGHFWVARRNGVKVTVFSIGFGPELFGFTDKLGTRWRFSLIPMGGYVKMLGDADASSTRSDTTAIAEADRQFTLAAKTPYQRMAVASAGPAANFIFAIVALTGLISFKGLPTIPTVIGSLQQGQPAAVAGLQVGDKILQVEEHPTQTFNDLRETITKLTRKEQLNVTIQRGSEMMRIAIPMVETDPQTGTAKPASRLGIGPSEPVWVTQSIGRAFMESLAVTWDLCAMTIKGITEMLTGKRGGGELGGILAIGDMASQSTKGGLATAVWFMVLLSVNLGFLNLLPIPVLDGGHILLCGIEAARGKPLSEKLQERIFLVGFIVLMMLMLYSTWNDLVRYGVASFFAGIFAKLKALF